MKLVGFPTAIARDSESNQLSIRTSVIAGEDKRNIVWEGRNQSVFPMSEEDGGRTAVTAYAELVEQALCKAEREPNARAILLIGRTEHADERVRNLVVKIGLQMKQLFGDRIEVSPSTFGDGLSAMSAAGGTVAPLTVEDAYEQHLRNLQTQIASAPDEKTRRRLRESIIDTELQMGDILIGYDSFEKLATLSDYTQVSDAYVPYYEELLRRANAGEPAAIGTLEMEMRHAALRLFVDCARWPQSYKAATNFLLTTKSDILAELPYRAGERMRRIFALEIRRLFGVRGNICVKSRHRDQKSPRFGDLTVVALADAADQITGEEPDMVHLRIPATA